MHSTGSDAVWLPSNSGMPHSEILGSKPGWRLPEAYRCLQRPSSPPHAKASAMHPFWLDQIYEPLSDQARTCQSLDLRTNPDHADAPKSDDAPEPDPGAVSDTRVSTLCTCHRTPAATGAAAAHTSPTSSVEDQQAYHNSAACQVEPIGIEPTTSALQRQRSPN